MTLTPKTEKKTKDASHSVVCRKTGRGAPEIVQN